MRIIALFFFIIFFNSCNSENHHLDGFYKYKNSFFDVTWEINGNNISINNSITGISSIKCRQYKNRIEIQEDNGINRILYVQENGDLKMSDLIIFKKIDEIKNHLTDIKNDTTIRKNNNEILDLSRDSYDSESAIIKDLKIVQNELYIVVDIISIKYFEDFNFEIVNTNPKLRTYKVKSNVITINSKCVVSNDTNYLIKNKNSVLNESPFGFVMISTNKFGELTEINLGCWN